MTIERLTPTSSYEEKWSRLNRNMRWEIADLLKHEYLDAVNRASALIEVRDSFYVRYGKRSIDIVVSAAALGATLPLNVGIAIATYFTLGRPIFFKQKRLGKHGKAFTLVKFRNMKEAFDENGHPLPGHLRVTKLGEFMRRTSLDELLNFWSILKGDMSLIGPRPLVPEYGPRYSDRHRQRLSVRPGLECPPRTNPVGDFRYGDQFENDVWYAANVSLRTDVYLTYRLVRAVFDRKESKRRSSAGKGSFMGYGEDAEVVDSFTVPEWALNKVLKRHGLFETPDDSLVQRRRS